MHLDGLMAEIPGPSLPDVPFDEMTLKQQRDAMAWLYGALSTALRQGADAEMVDILTEWYDEVFVALIEVDEQFRENFFFGAVFPPQGQKARKKYRKLAEEASES